MQPDKQLSDFLAGKSVHTLAMFHHFVAEYEKLSDITLYPAKSMIGISNHQERVAWITQLGKNFVDVVFPFKRPYQDNLCFTKIAQVPGQKQYNHHFRMFSTADINDEVVGFMKLAYRGEE